MTIHKRLEVAKKNAAPHSKMRQVLDCCRRGDWSVVLRFIEQDERVAMSMMKMDNNIETTVMHQAITGEGKLEERVEVIKTILKQSPDAAALANGYGSQPLHTLLQRNSSVTAHFKQMLIPLIMDSFIDVLLARGGTGQRTPLHVIFTNYVSARLTQMLIDRAPEACAIVDKKGWLPAHIACSRHCSPQKLDMLLAKYPDALVKRTEDTNDTLWSLAFKRATKAHPNGTLRAQLKLHYTRHGLWTKEMEAQDASIPKRRSRTGATKVVKKARSAKVVKTSKRKVSLSSEGSTSSECPSSDGDSKRKGKQTGKRKASNAKGGNVSVEEKTIAEGDPDDFLHFVQKVGGPRRVAAV